MGRRSAGSGRAADRARSGGHRPFRRRGPQRLPYDQRLSAAYVAGHEDTVLAGRKILVAGNMAALIELRTQVGKQPAMFGAEETQGQQRKLRRDLLRGGPSHTSGIGACTRISRRRRIAGMGGAVTGLGAGVRAPWNRSGPGADPQR